MIQFKPGDPPQSVSADVVYGRDGDEDLPLPDGTVLDVTNDRPEVVTVEASLDLATKKITGTATLEAEEIIDGKADIASGHLRVTIPEGPEVILGYQVALASDPSLRIVNLTIGGQSA